MTSQTRTLVLFAMVGAFALGACGNPDQDLNEEQMASEWTNVAPTLLVASPSAIAVGDPMTFLGDDFIDPEYGRMTLTFRGQFFDENGQVSPVDYSVTPTLENNSRLKWELWPNIVFSPTGDQLGRFVGEIVAISHGNDGTEEASNALPVAIDIKPSIIPHVVRPQKAGCSSIVEHTLENTPMLLIAEVVGLRKATKDTPLTFLWTFLYGQWNVNTDYNNFTPEDIGPKQGAITIEDRVTSGTTSTLMDGGDKSFLVKIGEDLIGNTRLKELRTGQIPDDYNNMPISANVAVLDASGKSTHLAIKMTIHKKVDMYYDGNMRIVERFAPVLVSGCTSGGNIGRDVSYSETKSESNARSAGFSYHAETALTLGLPSNPFALSLNLSTGFGVNVNEHVSSDKSKSLYLSGHILPGNFAAFYRQTSKFERSADLSAYSVCGEKVSLGAVILTDWTYTPDLAQGSSCPPPTNLMPAQKFEY
ncbi:MAG: hypothetical protein V1754_08125 [Pseudomonadota bacterium]